MDFLPKRVLNSVIIAAAVILFSLILWMSYGVVFYNYIIPNKDFLQFWIPLISGILTPAVAIFLSVILTKPALQKQRVDICDTIIRNANADTSIIVEEIFRKTARFKQEIDILISKNGNIDKHNCDALQSSLLELKECLTKTFDLRTQIKEEKYSSYAFHIYGLINEIISPVIYIDFPAIRESNIQIPIQNLKFSTKKCSELTGFCINSANEIAKIRSDFVYRYHKYLNDLM